MPHEPGLTPKQRLERQRAHLKKRIGGKVWSFVGSDFSLPAYFSSSFVC